MIKKVLIFFVLVSLCVYALAGCQQPPRKYSVEVEGSEHIKYPDDGELVAKEEEEETERGHPKHVQQQPPRDYDDDRNETTKP